MNLEHPLSPSPSPASGGGVRGSAGEGGLSAINKDRTASARLEAVFRDIAATRMAGLPIVNPALSVAAVGFRRWGDGVYGVLITPWFMNLIGLPDSTEEVDGLASGTRAIRALPSGDYEFLASHDDRLGGYWSSSLISPMHQFADMAGAFAVAEAVVESVFKAEPVAAAPVQSPSRRSFLTALMPKGSHGPAVP